MKIRPGATLALLLLGPFGVSGVFADEGRWELWEILQRQSKALAQQDNYSQAAEIGEQALKAAEEKFGPDDPRVAWVLSDLSTIESARGDYSKAEALGIRGVQVSEKLKVADPKLLGLCLRNLGTIYRDKGKDSGTGSYPGCSFVVQSGKGVCGCRKIQGG